MTLGKLYPNSGWDSFAAFMLFVLNSFVNLYNVKTSDNNDNDVYCVRYTTALCPGRRRLESSVDATRPLTSSSLAEMSWPSTSGLITVWLGEVSRRRTRPMNREVCVLNVKYLQQTTTTMTPCRLTSLGTLSATVLGPASKVFANDVGYWSLVRSLVSSTQRASTSTSTELILIPRLCDTK